MKAIASNVLLIGLLSCLSTGCGQERQSPHAATAPATAPVSESRIISLYDQLKIGMTRSQAQAIVGEPLEGPPHNIRQPNGEEYCGYISEAEAERKLGYYESPMYFCGIRLIYKNGRVIDKKYNHQWVKREHTELYERKPGSEPSPADDPLDFAPIEWR